MPLVGNMVLAWARLSDMRVPAILDAGSMISILPVGLLARTQEEAFDMEKLDCCQRNRWCRYTTHHAIV
ncbi:unnamed protein product [Haemonchus placei]|uniref:Peptidase A2 domain-containing protein n=1 Tax=Haemonchus placei TaxID=6290 RepID=A0A0N4XB68_HAEPC|nr:unnamed protein product [Haemonchus placei]